MKMKAFGRGVVGVMLVVSGMVVSAWVARGQSAFVGTGAGSEHPTKTIVVASTPDAAAHEQVFRDGHDGVSFRVPAGWELQRKDGQVSTFHQDARSAPRAAQMKAVAQIDFNPYPRSTFAGAFFYFSVEKKTTDKECAEQATSLKADTPTENRKDTLTVGAMDFAHGHDEHGGICTEARDEVYTSYRKHVCYRFDMAINTFCAISSGAQEISEAQLAAIDKRMSDILSTVVFKWEAKAGAEEENRSSVGDPKP